MKTHKRRALNIFLAVVMLVTIMVVPNGVPTAEAAITYINMSQTAITSGMLATGTTVTSVNGLATQRRVVTGHPYIAAISGTQGWASGGAAWNSVDYRAAVDGSTSTYFDGYLRGHIQVEFHEPQYIAQIMYRGRQAAGRLNGAVLEGSNDGVNYDRLLVLDGVQTNANTTRNISHGLKVEQKYKFARVIDQGNVSDMFNIAHVWFYTMNLDEPDESIMDGIIMPAWSYGAVELPGKVLIFDVAWKSKTPEIMDDDGILVWEGERPVEAILTATLDWNGTLFTRDFSITIQEAKPFGDSRIVEGMDLIAHFDFDADPAGGYFTGAGARARVVGSPSYGSSNDATRSVRFGSSFWLDMEKADGSPLLKGLDEFVVSYDVNADGASGNNVWSFFAQRTNRAPKTNWEHYLAIRDSEDNVEVRSWENFGSDSYSSLPTMRNIAAAPGGWRHIDVVFGKYETSIYVNGVLRDTMPRTFTPSQVLSPAGGFAYIGRSASGQFFTGEIDNFKVWKPKDISDAEKLAAAKQVLTLPFDTDKNPVYGNITLLDKGLHGTDITWWTDSPNIISLDKIEFANYDPRLPGVVTRPAGADAVVTMRATISVGSLSDTKEFKFTVKKAPAPITTEAYMFTYFTNAEGKFTDEQVYFAVSEDAMNWTDTRADGDPVLRGTKSDQGVRDPFIIRSPEGDKFYIIGTDLNIWRRGGWGSAEWRNSSNKIIVWESVDLVNWSEPRYVDLAGMIHDGGHLWAPEVVYDEITGDYFVFFATSTSTSGSTSGIGPWMHYSRTRDFHTFSQPKVWIPINNCIDTTAWKDVSGRWFRATKDESVSNVAIDRMDGTVYVEADGKSYSSLTGAYTRTATRLTGTGGIFPTTVGNYGSIEGPQLFLYNEAQWRTVTLEGEAAKVPTYGLYVDRYGTGSGYWPFATTDIASTARSDWGTNQPGWQAYPHPGNNNSIPSFGMRKRHGGLLTITKEEYDRILAYVPREPIAPVTGGTFEQKFLDDNFVLLADFDFNNAPTNNVSDLLDRTGNAMARPGGSRWRSSTDTLDGSARSADIRNDSWLNITKADGTPLLLNEGGQVYEEIIVSYDNKRNSATNSSTSGNWAFYLDRNTTANSSGSGENYIGTLDGGSSITIERFRGGRPGSAYYASGPYTSGATSWKHIDIIISPGRTVLYVDGRMVSQANTLNNTYKLSDILSSPIGGVMQLGRGNWTSSGEFHNGLIDNFKVYANPVISATANTDVPLNITPTTPLLRNVRAMTPCLDLVADMAEVETITYKEIDNAAKTVKLVISRSNTPGHSLSAIPLTIQLAGDAVLVNPQATYDLTSPLEIQISHERTGRLDTWTISALLATNPVLPGRFADPDMLIHEDRYYLYCTTDGYPSWAGTKFQVWSSEDMLDWTNHGVIIDHAANANYDRGDGFMVCAVPWARDSAWAPAIIEKNGKFYLYFSGHWNSSGVKEITVAWADHPAGPFQTLPTPMLTLAMCRAQGISMGQVIDPQIYTEKETGKSYMLFGNGNAAIVELGEDMISWVPGTMRNIAGATDFREAIMVNKIDGMYHFTWSCDDTGSENYHVKYGVSTNLYGPITYKGILLQKDNRYDIKGSAHHEILEHPNGKFYIIYHRFWTPLGQYRTGGAGNHRETCIDELVYRNGAFQPVTPTHAGITEPVPARVPITSLTINAPALTSVVRGGKYKFELTLNKGSTPDVVTWSVNNTTFATVTEDGSVTILNKTGTVILTATAPSGVANSIVLRIL